MIQNLQSDLRPTPARLAASCALVAASLLASAQTSAPTAPSLSPQPREIQSAELIAVRAASITIPGADTEDIFAAQNLTQALTQDGIHIAAPADLTITLLRADTPAARQLLTSAHLAFDAPMHDEGYILLSQKTSSGGTVTIIAQTSAGIFYGAQTLKQLIESSPTNPHIWTATIRD